MNALDRYINKRKQASTDFANDFEKGYETFKFGVLLKKEVRKVNPS